ncbi:putative transcription factor WD40-like family [Helianthus annuus]|nr:putative transcription factor WD40-like family [Helianthus annuus]KAJ0659798.1 putative transcription factor WD40-like family [Helianthus annuus]KAJ0840179.1 putative transcription factor WD40-like family [Helianthus annuus]KAJ0853554.1 putative transcription factor WD40-like family [Helianthus annuus]
MQAALVKDPAISVNRVIWSPDGSLFGVAYSRHIVQIYSYHGGDDASPRIRFNKDGALLAVSAQDNGIKILANSDGLWLL